MNDASAGLGRRLLRSAAQFSAGQVVGMLASIVRVAIAARCLSAEANGIWLGIQLLLSYGSNLHLGVLFGVFRSIPMLRAEGRTADAEKERQTAFTFTAAMSLGTAFPLYFIAFFVTPTAQPRHLVLAVAIVALTLIRSYYNTIFKAESRFKELAAAMAYGGGASLLAAATIPRWGLDGVLLSTAAQTVVESAVLAVRSSVPPPRIHWPILVRQMRIGIFTLLTSMGVLLLTTVDRTVMIQRLGAESAGIYYIGANIMVLIPVIAGMPASVLTPQFFERKGRGEDLLPLVERPLDLASLVFAVLVACGAAVLPSLIAILWPKLTGGTTAAQVALFATYPLVLAGLVTNIFYAYDRQGLQVIVLAVSVGVSFLAANVGVSVTHEITGAALGAAVGLYVYFPIVSTASMFVLGMPRHGLRLAIRSAAPALYAVLVVLFVRYVGQRWVPRPLVQLPVAALLSAVLVAPLLVRVRTLLRRGLTPAAG